MRILFVAMADSVHTARWIGQLTGQGWDIHLVPVAPGDIHPGLEDVTVHDLVRWRRGGLRQSVQVRGIYWPFPGSGALAGRAMERYRPTARAKLLTGVIRSIRPDIVHSLEFQHAGYLTLDARRILGDRFPRWIATNWGSDIYLFGRLSEHVDRVREILKTCDYYGCECQRDVKLAVQMGLQGQSLPVLPNAGGMDLDLISRLSEPGLTSDRRIIVLKGYQGWAGRALVGLRAIELSANELSGYRVAIYSTSPEVKIAAELLTTSTNIPVDVVAPCSHEAMLRLFGSARLYIGLSISDAISTSLLEAMAMGAFPIQSHTACADEWIKDGETGFIVHPDDPQPLAEAIRRALTNDRLVDSAAEANARVTAERLDCHLIRPQVIAMYEKVASGASPRLASVS